MNRLASFVLLALFCLAPAAAGASTVSAASISDGTYTVTVQRVVDAKHVEVKMDNGSDATLAAGRPSVDFSKVQPNDQLKMSVIGGQVAVYMDLTTH